LLSSLPENRTVLRLRVLLLVIGACAADIAADTAEASAAISASVMDTRLGLKSILAKDSCDDS
jgi:hypothetical protein